MRARGRFFDLLDLISQLEPEKAAGRGGRLAVALQRHDLVVIDELGHCPSAGRAGKSSSA